MQSSLIHNGFNLERRKQYQSNPRHNLNSSVSFVWRESLDSYPMKRSDLIKYEKQLETQNFKYKYNDMMDQHIKNEINLPNNSYRVMPAHRYPSQHQYSRHQHPEALNQQVQYYGQAKNQWHNSGINQPQTQQNYQVHQNQNGQQMRESNSIPMRNSQQRSFFYSPYNQQYQNQRIDQENGYIQSNPANEYQYRSKSLAKKSGLGNSQVRIPQRPAGYINHSEQNVSKAIFGYDVNKVPEKKNSYFNQILNSRLQPFLEKGKGASNGMENSSAINEQNKHHGIPKHQSFSINHPVYMNY